MDPGEPRQPDDRGAPRPPDDDDTFIFDRDDGVEYEDDGRDYDSRQTYAGAPEPEPGTAGPGYSPDAGYSPGAAYATGAGYTGDAGYSTDGGRFATGTARVGDPFDSQEITEEELEGLRSGNGGPRRVLPLEDEPTTLVARYLFPTERYRGEWKRHWVHLLTPLMVGIGATFALGYLSGFFARQQVPGLTTVAVIIWLGVMGFIAWKVLDWYFDRFILTNKRVMVVSGIVTRKVAMMPLLRVTDMKYEQSPVGRMLNYGTFVLESAGQDQALREVKHLPNPNELYLRVVEEMYEPQAVEARMSKDAEGSDDA